VQPVPQALDHLLALRHRGAALFTLAADVPAAILAKTLGIHVKAAIQWQKISGGDWAAYVSSRLEH
jgi:hypothetical protein